jgi:hypothetical protein
LWAENTEHTDQRPLFDLVGVYGSREHAVAAAAPRKAHRGCIGHYYILPIAMDQLETPGRDIAAHNTLTWSASHDLQSGWVPATGVVPVNVAPEAVAVVTQQDRGNQDSTHRLRGVFRDAASLLRNIEPPRYRIPDTPGDPAHPDCLACRRRLEILEHEAVPKQFLVSVGNPDGSSTNAPRFRPKPKAPPHPDADKPAYRLAQFLLGSGR